MPCQCECHKDVTGGLYQCVCQCSKSINQSKRELDLEQQLISIHSMLYADERCAFVPKDQIFTRIKAEIISLKAKYNKLSLWHDVLNLPRYINNQKEQIKCRDLIVADLDSENKSLKWEVNSLKSIVDDFISTQDLTRFRKKQEEQQKLKEENARLKEEIEKGNCAIRENCQLRTELERVKDVCKDLNRQLNDKFEYAYKLNKELEALKEELAKKRHHNFDPDCDCYLCIDEYNNLPYVKAKREIDLAKIKADAAKKDLEEKQAAYQREYNCQTCKGRRTVKDDSSKCLLNCPNCRSKVEYLCICDCHYFGKEDCKNCACPSQDKILPLSQAKINN